MESGYGSTAGSPESIEHEINDLTNPSSFSISKSLVMGHDQLVGETDVSTIELKQNTVDDANYDSDSIEDDVLSHSCTRISDVLCEEHYVSNNIKSDHKTWIPETKDPSAFHEIFLKRRQWVIDNATYKTIIGRWGKLKTISELVKLIRIHTHRKPQIDQIWFVFYWVAMNIAHDTTNFVSGKSTNQSPNIVFQARKGTHIGFASLFKRICTQLGISCEYIMGFSKTKAMKYKKGIKLQSDHAWNAIFIEHHWYLIDAMWAAGHLSDDKTKFERSFDAYYFLCRPEQFIYSHLPKSHRWQLLKESLSMSQYSKIPGIYPTYFKFGLELVMPHIQQNVALLPGKPFTMLTLRAPSRVLLSGYLLFDDQKVTGAHYIEFSAIKKLWNCYFAPRSVGRHKIVIIATDKRENEGTRAMEFSFDVTSVPEVTTSFPHVWHASFDYNIEIVYPRNTHIISLHSPSNNHSQVLIRAPADVELKGCLTSNGTTRVKGGDRVYFDRNKNLWRCKFAPNQIGVFEACIFARKKCNPNENNSFVPIVAFELPVSELETFITYPEMTQRFYDLKLRLISPKSQHQLIIEKSLPLTRICIYSPVEVHLNCHSEYRGQKLKDASFLQYNADKKHWECLFAPQCVANQACVIAARSGEERSQTVAKFDLIVTRFIRPMIFPLVYSRFHVAQCYIFEPLQGLLVPGATVNFRCRLPGAKRIFFEIDSDRGKTFTLGESLLEQLLTVGREKVTLFVQFDLYFEPLVRYSVKCI